MVKFKMFSRFNALISELMKLVYDEKWGEDLLPMYSEMTSYFYRMHSYFGYMQDVISESFQYQLRLKVAQVIA